MRTGMLVVLAIACTRPAEDRALAELAIGQASIDGAEVVVGDGLAAIRELAPGHLELWCTAPALALTIEVDARTAGAWTIVARNSLVDAVLFAPDGGVVSRAPGGRPTVATFRIELPPGTHVLRIAPPDADTVEPFRLVAMADIQTALPRVDDVFRTISMVAGVRFVIGMGDITERSAIAEYDLFETQLATLDVPFYTTIGNHELWGPVSRYFDRFGRASFHFEFKGTAFSFADSGDAGIDPLVEDWLVAWLGSSRDLPPVLLTHFPAVDPVGARYGAFRSTRDGYRLLAKLAEGGVDLTLYGHIHTYIEFENAGIPAFISGGGGADPMRGDGIDRHFLVIDFDGPIQTVTVQRVD
jgi:3',5'-cyclic-AMP phosphodiesterase